MSVQTIQTDVTIIGAGPIGIFSIFQAGMLGMKSQVIDALPNIGGQCTALYPEKPIYDIPAYPEIKAGALIENLIKQAAPFTPTYHLGQQVIKFSQDGNELKVVLSNGLEIVSKIVIIAAGCGAFGPKKPPLEGIEAFENISIFYAIQNMDKFADCKLMIAGGGDSAVDWAISLSKITQKLYLVHRRDNFKAAPESQRQLDNLSKSGKIELIKGYQLSKLIGEQGKLKQVVVSNLKKENRVVDVDFLLPFFGLSQDLGPISNWGLNVKSHHILVNQPNYHTNISGVYAVGDIATYEGKLKLILSGFSEAASALHHAYDRVFEGKTLHFEHSTTKGIGF
ncbi:MAG: NAD(P)/FAD-dependent oxidoreductase [Rickettsiaceae bacterium]|nr:MAG: NAD(P)/FAD-dependent oxidoreductase [Rickettsiaceae bacterium]